MLEYNIINNAKSQVFFVLFKKNPKLFSTISVFFRGDVFLFVTCALIQYFYNRNGGRITA